MDVTDGTRKIFSLLRGSVEICSFGSYFLNYKFYVHKKSLMTSVNFMNKCQKAMLSVKIMSHVNLREGCLEACLGRSLGGLLRAVLEGCLGRSLEGCLGLSKGAT